MKPILKLAAIIILFSSADLMSQNDTINWGRNSRYNKMYDAKTFTQIKGEITAIEQIVPNKGTSVGIHITVKTKTETYPIHLGPKWYLDKQKLQLKVGDKVEVQGSKVNIDSKQTIIATEVLRDDNTLILRDQAGKPLWLGKRNH
ncbi:MAG TPA: DNA-binding protein [Bacteroidia bacterium]|nr:DNA-binding protein [Bacteroidia bacterium]